MTRAVVEAALQVDVSRARQFYNGLCLGASDGHGADFVDGIQDWFDSVVKPYPDNFDDMEDDDEEEWY